MFLEKIPQDIFRVIFQYLNVDDLMMGEEAFLYHQELLSLYRSSLEGFILKEKITIQDQDGGLMHWIITNNVFMVEVVLEYLSEREVFLLNYTRSTLKALYFRPKIISQNLSELGYFPLLRSISFNYFVPLENDQLLTFFSLHPQLENVKIANCSKITNELIPQLSNYCPKIKILSLKRNTWVNDETISLISQGFPNLKSLDLCGTHCYEEESCRQFILSHPRLSGFTLPYPIFSTNFYEFYLRQLIFPSILSGRYDRESHSFAITSLSTCFMEGRFYELEEIINPEIFSLDILINLYHEENSIEILEKTRQIFNALAKFPSMIDLISQSQFPSILLNHMHPQGLPPTSDALSILFLCYDFHVIYPLLLEKYKTQPSSLIEIFLKAVKSHLSYLTIVDIESIIIIVFDELSNPKSTYRCLYILAKCLQESTFQFLIDPKKLLTSFNSIIVSLPTFMFIKLFDCLELFLSVDPNYENLFIESNIFPRLIKTNNASGSICPFGSLVPFLRYCLSSQSETLVDHLVHSGLFQYFAMNFSVSKYAIEVTFKQFLTYKNGKYEGGVNGMILPLNLRSKLFVVIENESEMEEVS